VDVKIETVKVAVTGMPLSVFMCVLYKLR